LLQVGEGEVVGAVAAEEEAGVGWWMLGVGRWGKNGVDGYRG
jgi:hypothetical protein